MESSRKFLAPGAFAILVIAGFFASTQVGAQVCPLSIGMPYRTPEVSTVYVITEGCEKRPVFNPDVYFSHFATFDVVKFVSASTLATVQNSPLQFLPWGPRRVYGNGALLKIVTDPKVYLLLDGKLYPITDEPMFMALGFKFSQVLDVMPEVMAKFVKQTVPPPTAAHIGHAPTGGPYINVSAIPEGNAGTDQLRIIAAPFPRHESDGVGAFRTQCQMSHMNFDDPLVFPGQVGASHLHAFFGNATVDAFLQAGHLRDVGTRSTCGGGIANLSGYWVPALIDATGVPLVPTNNIVYYKSGYGGIEPEDIKEFPVGLRMIAGNAKSSAAQEYAYWECLHVSNTHYASIPPSCPDGSTEIQMSIMFPQCWDGVNLDSPDHKSHMAYPRNGCPSTHPIAIPAISYNIRYAIPPEGTSGLRLASDMYSLDLPGGFSSHGDWWDGWDHEIVKKWMANCVNAGLDCGGGLISDTEYLAHD